MIFDPFTFDPVPARGKVERVTQEPFVCEAKLDGVRQVLTVRNGEVTLTGRRNSSKTGQKLNKIDWVPDLKESVYNILARTTLDNFVFDGELYIKRGTSNDVVSIFGSAQDVAVLKQVDAPLRFRVFDLLFFNGEDIRNWRYHERRQQLNFMLDVVKQHSPYIEIVPVFGECFVPSNAPSMLDDAYRTAISRGFEGLVVKTTSGRYDKNAWAKVKPTVTYDYVFCGIDESTSETYSGWGAAAIRLGLYVTMHGTPTLVELTRCSGMTEYWRAEFFTNWQKYVGMTVEVVAQQQFPTGALRHPRFSKLRPDVNGADQTLEKYGLRLDEIVAL